MALAMTDLPQALAVIDQLQRANAEHVQQLKERTTERDYHMRVAEKLAEQVRAASECTSVLHRVVEWWDGLPPNLRQDIEGSGAEPGCIAAARRALR